MLASKSLLTYTRLDNQADLTHFLTQAGFLMKEASGVYSYSTLGLIALRHLEDRLRTFMDQVEATEWSLSMLQSQDNWDKTGRADDYGDELMSVKLRNESVMRLTATAEEQITNAVAHHLKGRYVDHHFYQIGHKWRDEIRARGGLLRGREFRMMDAYHFSSNQERMFEQNSRTRDALADFLRSMGCQVRVVAAECGEIGGLMSEELQVATNLEETGWMEVGHCFALGRKYTEAFGFTDANGQFTWMSCQGLGTSRLLAVLLEARRDNVRLWGDERFCVLDDVIVAIGKEEATQTRARELHDRLASQGRRVLFDDRYKRAGQQLTSSEAVGAAKRWVVSDRLGEGVAEMTLLATGETIQMQI